MTARGKIALAVVLCVASMHGRTQPLIGYEVIDDSIPAPLTSSPGVAARGRSIVADARLGMCYLCHRGADSAANVQGTLAPRLDGVGRRWSEAQLRLRIVDSRRLNQTSIMPAYYRIDGLSRVGSAWQSRPIFDAQQVEDVVAYLVTLK